MKNIKKGQFMGIKNEMLSRFNSSQSMLESTEISLSSELDFFFENVLDTVVDYFSEKEIVSI